MIDQKSENTIQISHINIRQSIFFLLLKLVVLDCIAAVVVLIIFSPVVIPFLSLATRVEFIANNQIFFLILVVVKIILTAYIVLDWLNEYYEIRSDGIVHKKGMLWRKEDRYPFARIESIRLSQGILGKFFNYGTLDLFEYRLLKYATLYLIHNPIRYLNILHELIPQATEEKAMIREHVIRDKKEE